MEHKNDESINYEELIKKCESGDNDVIRQILNIVIINDDKKAVGKIHKLVKDKSDIYCMTIKGFISCDIRTMYVPPFEIFEEVIKHNYPHGYAGLSMCYSYQNKIDKAIEMATIACEMGSEFGHFYLGDVYSEYFGDDKDDIAIKHFEIAYSMGVIKASMYLYYVCKKSKNIDIIAKGFGYLMKYLESGIDNSASKYYTEDYYKREKSIYEYVNAKNKEISDLKEEIKLLKKLKKMDVATKGESMIISEAMDYL
jgi:hypothetical protein